MKRQIILTLALLASFSSGLLAGDIWAVNSGAYASNDWNALKDLYNLPRRTQAYRTYRDYLINNGTLTHCSGPVEVITYFNDAAKILGRDGNTYYLPDEDLSRRIGSR